LASRLDCVIVHVGFSQRIPSLMDKIKRFTPVVRPLANMTSQKVDYSLYLVTDSTEAILGSRDLVEVVEQALLGG
jgi:hypothetical protein